MTTSASKLKEIKEQTKKLNAEAKTLQKTLDGSKSERNECRVKVAQARKAIRASKKEIRELSATIDHVLHSTDTTKIEKVADDILEHAATLASALREFKTGTDKLKGM